LILDTSSVIVRAKRGEKIEENITSITLVEYLPIWNSEFRGRVYFLSIGDQLRASSPQEKLRALGKP